MLHRELEIAQSVPQAHLLPALASNLHASPHFIVTPYVEGVSVARLLSSQSRLDVPDAAWIARQTAEALVDLHHSGWLHGDIKPANLLISPHGHVTVLDCGLARRLNSRECHAEYQVAGTMEYSAPELLHPGEPIGELSDMYAVGVSLFQMLTGQLPFQAVDIPSWVQAHLQQSPPPLRTLMPYLPTEVAALLERMLAKQPLRRPTAKELVIELCAIEVDTFCERA